jgi:cell division protein FtsA
LPIRIGYPTEYLNKTNIDLVKQPTYATAIGLVLAGFRALDDRDLFQATSNSNTNSNFAQSKSETKKNKKDSPISNFFGKMLERTKNLLIDDIDEEEDYKK